MMKNTVDQPAGAVTRSASPGIAAMEQKSLRAAAFVVRCAGSATAAYELASCLGLAEASWAAMSAVIVSQERLHETRSSLTGRILGTLFGMVVSIAVSEIASRMALSTAVQLAVAVAICALVVRELPKFRVAMWTCPVVLLTARAAEPIFATAFDRGSEVILGALLGFAFHWVVDKLADTIALIQPSHPQAAQHGHHAAAGQHKPRQIKG